MVLPSSDRWQQCVHEAPLHAYSVDGTTTQLHSVSNGPSGEPAAPTAEFIIVVSNVAASHCFEWTEWEPAAPTAEFIVVVSNVPASCCFQCSSFAVLRMDRVYNITYIYTGCM